MMSIAVNQKVYRCQFSVKKKFWYIFQYVEEDLQYFSPEKNNKRKN
jgi:hypothetical protein